MQTFEYALQLSSGEYTDVTEINFNAIGDEYGVIFDEENSKFVYDILKSCTFTSIQAIEDAKIGLPKLLEKELKSAPKGALIKLGKFECMNIRDCPGRDRNKCSTRTIDNQIPDCFEYNFGCDVVAHEIKEFVQIVIAAWREDRYVFIIK